MTHSDEQIPQFDDAVVRAMAKWPSVPQCFGWLTLDRRGAWRIQGDIIGHPRANAFLSRHYRGDARGRWYVQNGPQRVFVELEYTPWVYRYQADDGFTTHTGIKRNDIEAALLDDEGNMLLVSGLGIGVLDDRDLAACSNLIQLDDLDDLPKSIDWQGKCIIFDHIKRPNVRRAYRFDPNPEPDHQS